MPQEMMTLGVHRVKKGTNAFCSKASQMGTDKSGFGEKLAVSRSILQVELSTETRGTCNILNGQVTRQ